MRERLADAFWWLVEKSKLGAVVICAAAILVFASAGLLDACKNPRDPLPKSIKRGGCDR